MTLRQCFSAALLFFASVAPLTAQPTASKLDKLLRDSISTGCTGTRSVIVRTKPGYREDLRKSLTAHGDVVSSEFPALDAIAADVHCEDVYVLAGHEST